MTTGNDTNPSEDPFDLHRFITAQNDVYSSVLTELSAGQKRSHWMWYVFPQLDGLGYSSTAKHYAIKSLEEAQQYLRHPVLGPRLVQCATKVLAIEGRSIFEIFGVPDNLKLRSCMTLFEHIGDDSHGLFAKVLDKYFQGERDSRTLGLLNPFKAE